MHRLNPAGPIRAVPLASALLACTLFAAPASAMTVLQAPLSDLVQASELVLHGTMAKVEVLDLRRQGKGVWTEYTLRIVEVYKGDKRKLGKTFSWRLVGGSTKDGMTLSVPGMPTFIQDEETVVLLERHSTGHTLTGAPQGKFHVERDAKGNKLVVRDLLSANVVRKDPVTGRLVSATGHRHGASNGKSHASTTAKTGARQSLSALRAEILGYVRTQATKRSGKSIEGPAPAPSRTNRLKAP